MKISPKTAYFFYSKLPAGVLKKIQENSFRKTIEHVYERSRFYRREFDRRGIDPRRGEVTSPLQLGDFFTTAEELREHLEEFVCEKPDTAFETTGTTSKKPKRVYFSRKEIEEAGFAGAVGFWGLGIRPEDRVASAFDYSFWVSGPVLQSSCRALGCFHVEAGRIDPAEFYDRLKDYGITVIVGDPSWLYGLSEVAQKKGAWPIKLMIGGGENVTEDMRRFMEKVWKAPFILSYGQTEAFGAIGMESLEKDGLNLNEFHNFFEIVDQNEEGYGELVYTTINRRVMPLVRYRSGDITRFLETPSKAHLPVQRIEKLKGRVNEWVATAMGNIAPWMFEPVFNAIPEIGPDWQVVLLKENNKDLIEFHVEAPHTEAGEEKIRRAFFSKFAEEFKDASKSSEMGLFYCGLKIHSKGSLRTGRKLARIVDKRIF